MNSALKNIFKEKIDNEDNKVYIEINSIEDIPYYRENNTINNKCSKAMNNRVNTKKSIKDTIWNIFVYALKGLLMLSTILNPISLLISGIIAVFKEFKEDKGT